MTVVTLSQLPEGHGHYYSVWGQGEKEVGYAVLNNGPEELNQIRPRIKESIVRDK